MKKKRMIYIIILMSFVFLSFIGYFVSNILFIDNYFNDIYEVVKIISFFLLIMCYIALCISNNKKKMNLFIILSSLIIIGFNVFCIVKNTGINNSNHLISFYNMSISDVYKWKNNNHIDINEVYEYSDSIDEYHVISQDIPPLTNVNDISSLTLLVSKGIDYNKEVIVPSFIGWDFDKVIDYLIDNYLENVEINFVDSNNKEFSCIKQEGNGTRKRSDLIKLSFSKGDVSAINIPDFTNKNILYAKGWLLKNGYSYDIKYDNSDIIVKNNVLNQSVKNMVYEQDNGSILLTISSGRIIKVPDFNNMSIDEINSWVIENNLRVNYYEKYSEDIMLGDIIDSNVNFDDIIESGKIININISKGKLEMIKYTTLDDFIDFATRENIIYEINYEYSDVVLKDNIISSSHKEGMVIKSNDTVVINISKGKKVIIPNMIGMSKDNITKKCSELKITCSFTYGGYTENTNKDISIKQSKNKDTVVSEGTSLVITLSSGKYVKVNVPDFKNKTKSQISSSCNTLGITCKFIYESIYSSVTKDLCVKQSVKGSVNKGSSVTITLSKGPAKSYDVIIDGNMLTAGNPEATKATLSKALSKYSDVNFVYEFKVINTGKGFIHPDSEIKVGKNTITQGKTYKIIIGK